MDDSLLPGGDPAEWVRKILKRNDDRGKQKLIGPSEAGSLCTYCVAERLLGIKPPQGRYWMGARVGTMWHQAVEEGSSDIPGVRPETKVTVGEIPGYGVIKGTADSLWVDEENLLDLKTTQRKKLALIKQAHKTPPDPYDTTTLLETRFKVQGYIGQTHLYGMALGGVKTLSLVYLCRDGSTDDDVWAHEMPYNPEYAEQVWNRLIRIWEALQSGRELATFAQHQFCWTCQHSRG